MFLDTVCMLGMNMREQERRGYPLNANKVQVVEWDLQRVVYKLVYFVEGHSPASVACCCFLRSRPAPDQYRESLSRQSNADTSSYEEIFPFLLMIQWASSCSTWQHYKSAQVYSGSIAQDDYAHQGTRCSSYLKKS